jgi:hypothetical protein
MLAVICVHFCVSFAKLQNSLVINSLFIGPRITLDTQQLFEKNGDLSRHF